MIPAGTVIETQRLVAPFGLGLFDAALGRFVSAGLAVRLFRRVGSDLAAPISARATRRDLFTAQDLPGLRGFEAGGLLSPPLPWLVEVRDAWGRYTPFVIEALLPHAGLLLQPACGAALWPVPVTSPALPLPLGLPLLGTPARPLPAGQAVVRATLVDADNGAPAAWAVLEIWLDGRPLGRGVADARGEVAASFAWPEPADPLPVFSPGSPPGPPAPAHPLDQARWPLQIAVRWQRSLPLHRTDPAQPDLPDLCALLTQPLAALSAGTSPPEPLHEALLRYGQTRVLAADAGARIFVHPA